MLLQGKDALVRSQTGSGQYLIVSLLPWGILNWIPTTEPKPHVPSTARKSDRLGSLAWDCCDTDRCRANFCNSAVVGLNVDVQLPAIAHGPIPRLMLGMQIQEASRAEQHTLLGYKLMCLLYSKLCLDVSFSWVGGNIYLDRS